MFAVVVVVGRSHQGAYSTSEQKDDDVDEEEVTRVYNPLQNY